MKTLCGTFEAYSLDIVFLRARKFVVWNKGRYGELPTKSDMFDWLEGYVGTEDDRNHVIDVLTCEGLIA